MMVMQALADIKTQLERTEQRLATDAKEKHERVNDRIDMLEREMTKGFGIGTTEHDGMDKKVVDIAADVRILKEAKQTEKDQVLRRGTLITGVITMAMNIAFQAFKSWVGKP